MTIRVDPGTESTERVEKERFQGKTPDLSKDAKAAASEAEEHRDRQDKILFWKDGSRLEPGMAGARVSWRHLQTWTTRRVYMGTNKEVFYAELNVIVEALEVASKG